LADVVTVKLVSLVPPAATREIRSDLVVDPETYANL
jgi:hypothetical protein